MMHSGSVFSKGTKKPLRAEFVSCSHAWGLKGFFPTAKGKFLVPLAVWALVCFHGLIKVLFN